MQWAILALISASHVVGAVAQYGVNTLAPFYQQELEISRAQVGLFFSAFYLGMAGLSFVAGYLTDRLGVRATALNGHLSLGLFTAAASLAPSFAWAFLSFFLAGLGYSFLNPASTKGVMVWFHHKERATAMGIKQTGVPAGGVVAAVLAPVLVLFAGWRVALAALGAINFFFGFLFWAFWREPPCLPGPIDLSDPSAKRAAGTLTVRDLICVSVGTAVLLVGQMSLLTYIPLYLKDAARLSPYWSSQALAVTQFGGMVGRIGWGVVSDRIFRGRRKVVLTLIGLLSVALNLLLGLVSPTAPLWLLVALIFFAGLCMVGYQGVSYALIGEIAGQARTGTALGLSITINSIGAIFGTPLFGYLVDATGSYAVAWLALAFVVLLGVLILSFFVQEPKAEDPPSSRLRRVSSEALAKEELRETPA